MVSFLVVLLVVLLVFYYLRANRMSRNAWLNKLSLPGRWTMMPAEGETAGGALLLNGDLDGGSFIYHGDEQVVFGRRGYWRLQGNQLELSPDGKTATLYELHLFKPGQIGLEDAHSPNSPRRIFSKTVDNVVSLHDRRS